MAAFLGWRDVNPTNPGRRRRSDSCLAGAQHSRASALAGRRRALVLPVRSDRVFACGLDTGARTPEPVPPPKPHYHEDALRAGVAEILTVSLAEAVGPVVDAAGVAIDPGTLVPTMSGCDGGGVRAQLELSFSTADNAASVERVPGAWDSAGYAPDRAMQTDLRSSERLRVASITIHDKTTIDGLVHVAMRSARSSTAATGALG